MSRVPTVSLSNLYTDLDFLAGIQDGQKYCFGKRFYVSMDWVGSLLRTIHNESQSVNGISIMENICTNAAQQYDSYCNNKIFGPTLLKKIIAARHGLSRVVRTYQSIQQNVTASNILNRAILILDNTIPIHIKIKEGIILEENKNSEEIKTEYNSSLDGKSSLSTSPDENEYKDVDMN